MAEVVETDDVLGGEPRLAGTRIGVLDVHELVAAGECPPADVADQLEISLAAVYTALAYDEEHPDEMRQVRAEREGVPEDLTVVRGPQNLEETTRSEPGS